MTLNTTGTISQTVFTTRKLIDLAFGQAKIPRAKITGEYIEIALDLLFLHLSTLASKGIALWAIQKIILPLYENVQSVSCPLGVVDVLNANLRTSTRLTGTYTATSGTAGNAFDGNLSTLCTQTAPGGSITMQMPSAATPVIFGILPAGPAINWSIAIQTSNDGVSWTTVYSNTALAVVPGQWFWVDVQGIPGAGVLYVRLQAGATTKLNVAEFVVANNPQEIPLAKINRDDYSNLPDKWFPGRPVQFWYDKQIDQPIITLWPIPQQQFTFAQVVGYVQNYIQDVGSLTQSVQVPQRWYLAILSELSRKLALQIDEAKADPVALGIEADREIATAWASETDSSPIYLRPRLWSYTR